MTTQHRIKGCKYKSYKNKMNNVSSATAAFFLAILVADLHVNAGSLTYKELPVERVCRATKSEISLSTTKAAVFYFDESKSVGINIS